MHILLNICNIHTSILVSFIGFIYIKYKRQKGPKRRHFDPVFIISRSNVSRLIGIATGQSR